MAWIVIIVLLLVAFGPILWLMPSRRDRRLSALRSAARQAGLAVELVRLPRLDVAPEDRVNAGGRVLDTARELAVYRLPLPRTFEHLPSWRAFRAANGLPAWPGWVFASDARPDHPRLAAVIATLASQVGLLRTDVAAIECEPRRIGLYWLESPNATPATVTELGAWLRNAGVALLQLDAALAAPAEPLADDMPTPPI
ncbi:MAG: hypothetical protein ACO3Z6_08805 [Pseudomonadales bacterium]